MRACVRVLISITLALAAGASARADLNAVAKERPGEGAKSPADVPRTVVPRLAEPRGAAGWTITQGGPDWTAAYWQAVEGTRDASGSGYFGEKVPMPRGALANPGEERFLTVMPPATPGAPAAGDPGAAGATLDPNGRRPRGAQWEVGTASSAAANAAATLAFSGEDDPALRPPPDGLSVLDTVGLVALAVVVVGIGWLAWSLQRHAKRPRRAKA